MINIEKEKQCSRCKIIKPLIEFHNCKSKNDGKVTHCKLCQNKYYLKNKKKICDKTKETYLKNKENFEFMNKRRNYSKIYRENNKGECNKWRIKRKKEMIIEKGSRCEMCGFDDIRILEFHHKHGREKDEYKREILNKNYDLNILELLCPNCHALKHYAKEEFLCVS